MTYGRRSAPTILTGARGPTTRELSIAVLDADRDTRSPEDPGGLGDGARSFARHLRTTVLAEHLGIVTDDLVDPVKAFDMARSAALELDRWHHEGRRGPRPNGRLRVHHLPEVRWWEKCGHGLCIERSSTPTAGADG